MVRVHAWMWMMISLLLSAGKKRFMLAATQDSLLRGSRPPCGFTPSRTGTVEVWVCTDEEPWWWGCNLQIEYCPSALGLLSMDTYKLHVYVYERIITHTLPDWAVVYAKNWGYTKSVYGRFHTAKRGFFGGVTGGKGGETWGPSPTRWRRSRLHMSLVA